MNIILFVVCIIRFALSDGVCGDLPQGSEVVFYGECKNVQFQRVSPNLNFFRYISKFKVITPYIGCERFLDTLFVVSSGWMSSCLDKDYDKGGYFEIGKKYFVFCDVSYPNVYPVHEKGSIVECADSVCYKEMDSLICVANNFMVEGSYNVEELDSLIVDALDCVKRKDTRRAIDVLRYIDAEESETIHQAMALKYLGDIYFELSKESGFVNVDYMDMAKRYYGNFIARFWIDEETQSKLLQRRQFLSEKMGKNE